MKLRVAEQKTVLSKWIFISISLEILFFHSVRMKWKPCSQRKHAERKRLLKERENLLRNLRRKEIRSVQRSRQKQKLEILKLWQNIKQSLKKADSTTVRELEERRTIARERSRKSAEKRKQRAENDPEYAKYLEERNAEYNRRHTARRKEQMEALRARAEAGDQEAQSQLAERKQYQVRATVKSYRKCVKMH